MRISPASSACSARLSRRRAQGEAALADLARHPATAKFIATKLARHFVADDPPPALVARLTDFLLTSDGDLKALAMALLDSDEAWPAPLRRCARLTNSWSPTRPAAGANSRDPGRYGGALMRSASRSGSRRANGFPDSDAAWAAPEG